MSLIIGLDEVGRGCWAGPLVAGAVLLDRPIVGLKDSKLLAPKRREALVHDIEIEALSFGLGWVPAEKIDKVGITAAVKMAMEAALMALKAAYAGSLNSVEIIVDGNLNYLDQEPLSRALIKADMTVPAASAASILAKVARDRFMQEQAVTFPQYGFEKHVGYGTAVHIAALKEHGICVLHRKSYKPIRDMIEA